MKKILLFIFFTVLTVFGGEKNTTNEKSVHAFKLNGIKIQLDGKLNEPIWNQPYVTNFTQKDPNEGSPATEQTQVWVAYDDANLYIAAKLKDSKPQDIDKSIARRDADFESDWFGVYIDSYNDKKSGYYFGVNPGGTLLDGVLFNDSWDDKSWDGIWFAKTNIEEDGWSVELQIPFSQLRFNEADQMVWGVNFIRKIKRIKEDSYFVMVPKKESGFVSRFAALDGLIGIKPKQRFEVLPYFVQKTQFLVHDSNDPFYKSNQFRSSVGADFKISVGSSLNLDATINPDFGQVEVDPAVINLSAFESYFEEKRPFFIEGNDLFYFGIGGINNNWGFNFGWPELFYSRRIGRAPHLSTSESDYVKYPTESRIIGAAKLTGKIDETLSIAAISSFTERTYAKLFTAGKQTQEEVEPFTHYGVFRTRKQFNNGDQALGLMVTSVNRDLDNGNINSLLAKNAFTYGLDGWTMLGEDKEYAIAGAFAGSYVSGSKEFITLLQQQPYRYFQRPDANFARLDSNLTSLSGYFGRIMLNKQKGNFYLNSAIGVVSPGFENNDLGFQFMADRINGHLVLGYRWFEPDGIFRNKRIYATYARSYDFDGNIISNFLWYRMGATFTNYYSVDIGGNYQMESYSKSLTRGGPVVKVPKEFNIWLDASSDSREKVIFNTQIFFAKDDFGGKVSEAYLGIEWRPDTKISLSISPSYSTNDEFRQWVGNFDDDASTNTYKTRYVFARIDQRTFATNIRLNWTFTPALSLQLFLQPFFAVGKYSEFKEIAKPRSTDLNYYGKNGSTIIYDKDNGEYTVDPDGNGPANSFTFSNPDFNYKSLRGTAVLRWEFLPGSIFYLVWSHNQNNYDNPGELNIGRDFKNLWRTSGDDILMAKFSYWLDI